MKAEESVAEPDRDHKDLFSLPRLSLWPLVANILSPRGFSLEAQPDVSFRRFPAVGVRRFGLFNS